MLSYTLEEQIYRECCLALAQLVNLSAVVLPNNRFALAGRSAYSPWDCSAIQHLANYHGVVSPLVNASNRFALSTKCSISYYRLFYPYLLTQIHFLRE